jgi:RimJ/RimL family protein N-acetyltransferase
MVSGRSRLTDRLRLVPIGPEHVDDLVALHADEAVAAWHGGPWSVADARRRAEWAQQRWHEVGVDKWMAYDRQDDSLVGRGGVSLQIVDGIERLEAGWTVVSHLWGRGYASERPSGPGLRLHRARR